MARENEGTKERTNVPRDEPREGHDHGDHGGPHTHQPREGETEQERDERERRERGEDRDRGRAERHEAQRHDAPRDEHHEHRHDEHGREPGFIAPRDPLDTVDEALHDLPKP